MESLDETAKNISSNMGFFKHVFNFDDDSKSDMLNIIQYAIIALVPIVVLNKVMQKYVPEAEEEKGSVELLAEVVIQLVIMFIGILIIHRIITYVPTYSGTKYPEFSVIYIILAVMMITLSLQTKLGEKVSILYDRVVELWEGKPEKNDKKKKKTGAGYVKVSQPISQGQNQGQDAHMASLYGGGGGGGGTTSINSLPMESFSSSSSSSSSGQQPDYNAMYQNTPTPMPGAASPGSMDNMIMAANEVLGGGFGSSW
jgi:hypothetical protein